MHLTVLETFEDFLSNDLKKAKLEGVCREIFTKLSDGSSHCCISFEPFNILTLNYEKKELLPPPLIEDWHVPVPLADLEVYKTLVTDLVILKVLSCIDGRKYVKVISNELNLSQNNTRLCLKYLFFQGLIDFIDLFQVANVYRITEKVHLLLHGLAEESVRHLGKGKEIDEFLIFNLYCTLSDRSISDFLEENPEVLFTVDIELLIAYGVLRGVIRRVHKYCVMVDSAHVDKENYLKNAEKIVEMEKYGMLKGNTCMDEIVTHFETQQRSVEGVVKDISLFFYK